VSLGIKIVRRNKCKIKTELREKEKNPELLQILAISFGLDHYVSFKICMREKCHFSTAFKSFLLAILRKKKAVSNAEGGT